MENKIPIFKKITIPPNSHQSTCRYVAVSGEMIVILAELLLVVLSYNGNLWTVITALIFDFILLSPLKAGRALLCDTMAADPSAVSIQLLFRYYRHGYVKSLLWRLLLWSRLFLLSLALSVFPSLLVFLERRFSSDQLLQTGLQLLSYFYLVAAVVILLIIAVCYSSSPFLLLYTDSAAKAFQLRKHITHKKIPIFLEPHWNFLRRLPFLLLIIPIPYFLTNLHIEQAIQVRCEIDRFLQKKSV